MFPFKGSKSGSQTRSWGPPAYAGFCSNHSCNLRILTSGLFCLIRCFKLRGYVSHVMSDIATHAMKYNILGFILCYIGRTITLKERWGLRRWFANATHRGTGSGIPPLPRAEFGRLKLEWHNWLVTPGEGRGAGGLSNLDSRIRCASYEPGVTVTQARGCGLEKVYHSLDH